MYIYILYIFLINRIDKHVKHYILMLTEKNISITILEYLMQTEKGKNTILYNRLSNSVINSTSKMITAQYFAINLSR